MGKKVEHMIMSEEDIDEFIELLKKNRYYLLKLDKSLSKDEFMSIQKKRGYMFSAITKINGKIVAHIAAYRGGGQKIANSHQVFLATMVIDKQFRNALFSLTGMYALAMQKLNDLGYTDIICDCAEHNMLSLRMIRKFGGIMLDDNLEIYRNYILHNYMLSLNKMVGTVVPLDKETFTWLPIIKKSSAVHKENIIDDRYVWQTFHYMYGELSTLINIHTGYVCGLILEDMISIIPKKDSYEIVAYPCKDKNYEVICYQDDVVVNNITFHKEETEQVLIDNMNDYNRVLLINHNKNIQFSLFPTMDKPKEEKKYLTMYDDITYESDYGVIHIANKNNLKLCEMWPCFTYPYNLGYLQPDRKKLEMLQKEDEYCIKEEQDNFIMVRTYKLVDQRLEISTKLKFYNKIFFEPILNLFFEDLTYRCEIVTPTKTIEKEFNFARDNATGNEEVIFADFRKEEYSKETFKCIKVLFDDVTYRIETEKAYRCFHQYNYIGLVPNWDIKKEMDMLMTQDTYLDFGVIYVSIENNEG